MQGAELKMTTNKQLHVLGNPVQRRQVTLTSKPSADVCVASSTELPLCHALHTQLCTLSGAACLQIIQHFGTGTIEQGIW